MLYLALIALALFFGYGLTSQGLWHDEGFSYLLATMPRESLMQALHSYNVSPPLWYLTCSAMITSFGGAAWAIRVPSFLATLGSCCLLFHWMRRRVSVEAAYLATGLFATLPLAHFYAHEGRYYALLGFLYLAAVVAADEILENSSRKALGFLILSSTALLYLHNYGVVLVVCLNGYFLFNWVCFSQQNKRPFKPWLFGQVAVFILFLPWLSTFFQQLGLVKEKRILTYAWKGQNFLTVVLSSMRNLVPGDASINSFLAIPHLPKLGWSLTLLAALVLAWTLPAWIKEKRQGARFIFPILAPLFFISLYSQLRSPAYLIGKTEAMVMPLSCAFLGYAFSLIKMKRIRRLSFGILLVGGVFAVGIYHFSNAFPAKHWDLLTTRRIFLGGQPDLTILSVQTTAAIPSQLAPMAGNASVMLFPDPSPHAMEHWRDHFLPLNAEPEKFSENVDAGLKNLDESLVGKKKLVLVLYSLGQKQGVWIYPDYTQSLLKHLKDLGYVEEGTPASFPMDWISGFHIVRNFKLAS